LIITEWSQDDAKNLTKQGKGIKLPIAKEELLKWIKHLNPVLHTGHWRILHR
jgi:hypothetical protein